MINNDSISQARAVKSAWQSKRASLLDAVKPYRQTAVRACVVLILAVVSFNGFDDAGLQMSVNEAWSILGLLLPFAIVFATDCDLVGVALNTVQKNFFFIMSLCAGLITFKLPMHISPTISINLPPPRFAS